MIDLSGREKRLVVVFVGLLLLVAAYVFLSRGGEVVEVPEALPVSPAPSVSVDPSPSPVFIVPPGARDPFGG